MSLLNDMLGAARRAPALLGSSGDLVRGFLLSQQNSDGGFRDRAGNSDLYYTVFGLAGLAAFEPVLAARLFRRLRPDTRVAFARAQEFLGQFGSGDGLDFVHLCSLARLTRATAPFHSSPKRPVAPPAALLSRVEAFRSEDGGYHPRPGMKQGTAYGAFLAMGAYQDLSARLPASAALLKSIQGLRTSDGGWTNEHVGRPPCEGSTNATAAAVAVIRQLRAELPLTARDWLLSQARPQGGFVASPRAPLPDLLSTASALQALSTFGVSFGPLRTACLDFIDSLWTNSGGFHGHWGDDQLDVEYTFYGLLALGHLRVG